MMCWKPIRTSQVDNNRSLYLEIITKLFLVPRRCESASCSGGDADGRGHHEEGGSLSEDNPTLLCGHADYVHPPLYPSLLHGLSHTESLRGQSLPDRTVWVSEKRGAFLCCCFHASSFVSQKDSLVFFLFFWTFIVFPMYAVIHTQHPSKLT